MSVVNELEEGDTLALDFAKLAGVATSGGVLPCAGQNVDTGEVRVLRSVHAADAGTVVNPMQCRGQVEGGVAQALGAALFERFVCLGNLIEWKGHADKWVDLSSFN